MDAIAAELIKLRRSLSWAVVILLPIVLVTSGSIMTLVDGRGLEDGWRTLWMRSFVFYGLFPLAVGIAILASLIWRAEHRGHTWNVLMSGPTSSLRIVMAKATVVGALAALMQLLALATMIVLGALLFHLPGLPPLEYFAAAAVVAIACFPVAALQSWLSMVMRSFAAPVAAAFVGAGFSSLLLVLDLTPVIFLSPYATLSRATQLGSATFADTGQITGPLLALVVAAAVFLSVVLVAASTTVLERSDIRT